MNRPFAVSFLLILAILTNAAANVSSSYGTRKPIKPFLLEIITPAESEPPPPSIRSVGPDGEWISEEDAATLEPSTFEPLPAPELRELPPPPPEILLFSVSPREIAPDAFGRTNVMVEWDIAGAEKSWINGIAIPPRGRSIIRPEHSLALSLSVWNTGGSRTETVRVAATGDLTPAATITVRPSRIAPGETAIVAWRTIHGEVVTINGFTVAKEGREEIRPDASSTFDLIATGGGGVAYSSAAIAVEAPNSLATNREYLQRRSGSNSIYPTSEPLPRLHFRPGDVGLSDADIKALGDVAAQARSRAARLLVVGYTDATGDPESNKALSLKRAEAVKRELVARFGLDPNWIVAEGRGEADPIAPNGSALGRELNRRVEFEFR